MYPPSLGIILTECRMAGRITIPDLSWDDISKAPKDGQMVFLMDDKDEVDIARWGKSTNEWNCEFGCVSVPILFSRLSIEGGGG